MAMWFLFLVPFFTTAESVNETDFQIAVDDMRTSSYNGFVIILKILNPSPDSLSDGKLTFLIPVDEELSKFAFRADGLQQLVLTHSILSALLINHLLHFPNGSLVPSSVPNRMLRITNTKKSGLFINNARIITPNVCLNSLIRCHGICTTVDFDNGEYSVGKQHTTIPI